MFQSAPGHLAGRCACARIIGSRCWLFQSAPGHLAGRCIRPAPLLCAVPRFNPRPAIWPGDALDDIEKR